MAENPMVNDALMRNVIKTSIPQNNQELEEEKSTIMSKRCQSLLDLLSWNEQVMDHGKQRKEKRQGDSDQVKALDTVNALLQLLSTHNMVHLTNAMMESVLLTRGKARRETGNMNTPTMAMVIPICRRLNPRPPDAGTHMHMDITLGLPISYNSPANSGTSK